TAKSLGLATKTSIDFAAQDYLEGVGSASSLTAAFTLPEGQVSDPVTVGNNQVVFRVLARIASDESAPGRLVDQLSEEVLERKSTITWELYEQKLKDRLKASGELKVNDAAMKNFLATYQRT